jgi:hypothetical protein
MIPAVMMPPVVVVAPVAGVADTAPRLRSGILNMREIPLVAGNEAR